MNERSKQKPDPLWSDALEGVDLSSLGKGKGDEYPTLQPDQVSDAMERSPVEGILMRMANAELSRVRAQAEGKVVREKEYRLIGWRLCIQTPKGLIGIINSWVGNQINLSYSNSIASVEEVDPLIARVLELEKAMPIQVGRNAAGELNVGDEVVDAESFLKERDPDRLLDVIYTKRARTMFSRFYGPIESTGGRVWVDRHTGWTQNFRYIENGEMKDTDFWKKTAIAVFTFPHQLHNDLTPEGPTTSENAIQRYRDRFILLASELAFIAGGPTAVNLNPGLTVLTPEDLYREGYSDIQWLKGDLGERKGFGAELVKAKKGDSTVFLESANLIVPWSMLLHAPISRVTTPQALADFIGEDLLWF